MRICIIGSGATGLILSILLKQQNKDNDVFVIEKNANSHIRTPTNILIRHINKCKISKKLSSLF